MCPKSVLGSAGSKNISYDRKRKGPSGPICLHVCAVLNPSPSFILQIPYFPSLPQIPFDIYQTVQPFAFIIFLGVFEIVYATSVPHSPLLCSTCVLLFVPVFQLLTKSFYKAFCILLVQTTLIHIIAQSVLRFCKLL